MLGYLHFGQQQELAVLRLPIAVVDSITSIPVEGAYVGLNVPEIQPEKTDHQGHHTFQLAGKLIGKPVTITITKDGYTTQNKEISSLQSEDKYFQIDLVRFAMTAKASVELKDQGASAEVSQKGLGAQAPRQRNQATDKQSKLSEEADAPVIVAWGAEPDRVAGSYFERIFRARGGTPPYQWFFRPEIKGLELDRQTGILRGNLAEPGMVASSVQVRDSRGSYSGFETLTFNIVPPVQATKAEAPPQIRAPQVQPESKPPEPARTPTGPLKGIFVEDSRIDDAARLLAALGDCFQKSPFETRKREAADWVVRCAIPGTTSSCIGSNFSIVAVTKAGDLMAGVPANVPVGGFEKNPARESSEASRFCRFFEQKARGN